MSAAQPIVSRNAWLWWKEARMVAPLVVMLFGVTALLLFLGELSGRSGNGTLMNQYRAMTMLVIPCVFAIGAGAALVGQEREQRTIEWMMVIPISPRQWIVVKLCVAAIGLAVMWALAIPCFFAFDIPSPSLWSLRDTTMTGVRLPVWMLQSVYLLFASFYASWKIHDNFRAILLVVLLSLVPLVAGHATMAVIQIVGSVVLAWLGYRSAIGSLGPVEPDTLALADTPVQSIVTSVWDTSPNLTSPTASMIWQSVWSSPMSLGAVAAMAIGGSTLPWWLDVDRPMVTVVSGFGVIALTLLSMCWLGVLVFQNDGAAARLRFLADRGVGPTKVWLARQALPLSILASGVIVYTFFAAASGTQDRIVLPSMLVMAAIAWGLYSVSQWASQTLGSLVLAAIVGPITAIGLVGWSVYSHTVLLTPLWLLVGISLLPMIATWALMGRFMEGRDRPISLIVAGVVLAAWIFVPIFYFASLVMGQPSMQTLFRSERMREALRIRQTATIDVTLSVDRRSGPVNQLVFRDNGGEVSVDDVTAYIDAYPETPDTFIVGLNELRRNELRRNDSGASAGINEENATYIHSRLAYERMNYESSGDWEAFSPWLRATSEIIAGLRRSPRWLDQDIADTFEIWVLETVESASASEPSATKFIANLPSIDARNQSRRRAVLATWLGRDFQAGVVDRGRDALPNHLAVWSDLRRRDAVVETALLAIDGDDHWRERMHALQFDSQTPFEIGPYSKRFQRLPDGAMITGETQYPSSNWFLDWENEIAMLQTKVTP